MIVIKLPDWYQPLTPIPEPIVAELIEVQRQTQLIHVSAPQRSASHIKTQPQRLAESIPRTKTQPQRPARRTPSSAQMDPKITDRQIERISQQPPTIAHPLHTDVQLSPTVNSPFFDQTQAREESRELINETIEIGVEPPRAHQAEKGDAPQAQETAPAAETGEGQTVSRDAQMGSVLQTIAGGIASGTSSSIVDIVFLLDASGSMGDNIQAVRNHLVNMVEIFQQKPLDFTLGVVTFKSSAKVFPQTRDYQRYERLLENVQVGGDERAYDAIVRAIAWVQFRPGAERRFILVTDEPCKGSYTFLEVLKRCREARITVDVIGINDPSQRV
ncbi:VWA domain-containing protein, partial [Candidatus Poribacteria bacterium]|nr:VWA domain-containing protein [Candidatus Poribacteria bacterium]